MWKQPVQFGVTLNKRQFCSSKKLIWISLVRTVTICDMDKSNTCFCISLDTLGKSNFWSKLYHLNIKELSVFWGAFLLLGVSHSNHKDTYMFWYFYDRTFIIVSLSKKEKLIHFKTNIWAQQNYDYNSCF